VFVPADVAVSVSLPLAAFAPLQLPDAKQPEPSEDQERVTLSPAVTVVGAIESAGGGGVRLANAAST
jgi:hypothetical protein